MNILHILSQTVVTGAETYAASLANYQIRQGHNVFIISDTFATPTKASVIHQPIAKRNYAERISNISFIRKMMKQHQIDVVHAHSRASSWVAYFACLTGKVPLISTVHGRQHLHTSTWLYSIYGDKQIAVCDNIKEHLINEVKLPAHAISVIPNGFEFSPLWIKRKNNVPTLSVIGRTNGGKGEKLAEMLLYVFPELLARLPDLHLNIIGGVLESLPQKGQNAWLKLKAQYSDRTHWIGFVPNLPDYILQSDLVIGSGRVAIETLYCQTSLFAFGEAQAFGLVTSDNYLQAKASNFGDILADKISENHDYQGVLNQLVACWNHKTSDKIILSEKVQQDYSLDTVATRVQAVYESARMKRIYPQHIPVLMYHRIPESPSSSPNRIFVTKDNFEKHLIFLKENNFTTLTFLDYQDFAQGRRSVAEFPKRPIILTFDDGYADNYTNALPLMQKYGFKGVLYLLGSTTPDHNAWDVAQGDELFPLLTQAQRQVFVKAGWEIGAHTLTHRKLTILWQEDAFREISQSKKLLEDSLSTRVISFAYPYGDYNYDIKKLVQDCGFTFAVATDSGGLHLEDDRFAIFRVNIFPEETRSSLRKKTTAWYRKYYYWKRKK